jgi:hypothetical protein
LKGFGDLVPGINQLLASDKATGGRNLLIAFVYIFIGMAILAMCFDLMQHELVEKFVFIAKKLGITEKDKEDIIKEKEEELEKQKKKEEALNVKEVKTPVPEYNDEEEIVKKAFELPTLARQKTAVYHTDVPFSASVNSNQRKPFNTRASSSVAIESAKSKQINVKPVKIQKDPTVISFEGEKYLD